MQITLHVVDEQSAAYQTLLATAEQLNQARYILAREQHIETSIVLGAFAVETCVGFLRLLIQIIGSDEGRTPIRTAVGEMLREGYVEAFGVLPRYRRQGVGQALQEFAIAVCREQRCYQIRSRSPITSAENYALKLKMGYAIQPSNENDSYYFIKTLAS